MRRLLRLLLHGAGALAAMAAVLLALLAWRLAQGPLPLDLLLPRLEAALGERAPQSLFGAGQLRGGDSSSGAGQLRGGALRVTLDGAELVWGDWQETFELRLAGLAVADAAGRQLLAAPAVAMEMALPPLARGELRLLRIVAERPALAIRLDEDGPSLFGAGQLRGGDSLFGAGQLRGGALCFADRWPAPFRHLEEVLLRDATLDGLPAGWRATAATLSLRRGGNSLFGAGQLRGGDSLFGAGQLRGGASGPVLEGDMTLRAQGRAAAAGLRVECRPGQVRLAGRVDGLAAAQLASLLPQPPDSLFGAGQLRGGNSSFGAGQLRGGALAAVDLALDGRFDLRFDRHSLSGAGQLRGGNSLFGAGQLRGGALALTEGSFTLATQGGRIGLEGLFAAPVALGPSRATGRFVWRRPASGRRSLHAGLAGLELRVAPLGLEGGEASARIALDGFAPASGVEFRLDVAELEVDRLAAYWPLPLATDTRRWVAENLSGGRIREASLAFATTVGALLEDRMPAAALAVDVDVAGTAIAGLGALPPVVGASGRVRIRDGRLAIATEGGQVAGLALAEGSVAMARLAGDAPMRIQARLSGPLAGALAIAGREPFALAARLGLEPRSVRGRFDGQVDVLLPRLDGLEAGTVRYRAAIEARLAGLARPLFGYRLDGGNGSVTLDGDGVAALGTVRVNGVPFRAQYRQALAADAPVPRRARLEGRLSDEDRRALGFADPVAMEGPVEVAIEARQTADGQVAWTFAADLAPAAMAFPPAGLAKRAGEPGRLMLELVDSGGPELAVAAAMLEAGGVTLEGSGRVSGRDGSPLAFQVSRLAFGRNRIAGSLRALPDGALVVALAGGEADMNSLFGAGQLRGGASLLADDVAGTELPPLIVQGSLDRLWTAPAAAIEALEVRGRWNGGHWEALEATGFHQGGSPMTAKIARAGPDGRRFDYRAEDAGDALGTFGLLDSIEGGSMEIEAVLDDGAAIGEAAGTVRIDDFVLREAPLMARLLSLVSLPAIVNTLAGDGLAFQSAVLPFRKQGDVVAFHDARLFGPGIGITFAGTVDLASARLDLEGTLIPAYLLNALPGAIPILGDLLTGGEEGGGVFGFAFQAQGALDDPAVTVHPLSVLAPGFLRRIFQAPDGDATAPDDREGR